MEKLRGSVRPIVTLLFSLAAIAAAFTNHLSQEQFYTLITLVVGFYFIQRSAGKGGG